MKLELKHLAPYLPYGLKVLPNGSKQATRILGITFNPENLTIVRYGEIRESKIALKWVKPILRPLSDLTKRELIRQGFASHIDFLTHEKMNPLGYDEPGYSHRSGAPAEMVLYLFSKHFDVFGLIDAGLAIDINSLNP